LSLNYLYAPHNIPETANILFVFGPKFELKNIGIYISSHCRLHSPNVTLVLMLVTRNTVLECTDGCKAFWTIKILFVNSPTYSSIHECKKPQTNTFLTQSNSPRFQSSIHSPILLAILAHKSHLIHPAFRNYHSSITPKINVSVLYSHYLIA
jgi:hypothetical protein